ncbi:MAG: hypothetical protein CL843_16325 [Crocinitomicaceae bacterium]|nr:hypothetical protein [Crocinitomicaceae bacterium]|tara:strand:- start:5130 stop:5516 length:387 start_codon:yes stop_codon:yes gene_type:complete
MSYKAYFRLEKKLKAKGMRISREELVLDFTNGVKSGLRQLTTDEYSQLIAWMADKSNDTDWLKSPANRMRQKVYAILVNKCGYTAEQMDNWCIKYGHAHKKLQDHNYKELVTLVSQAEQLHQSIINAV